ncbi:MAG: transglutaminase, partial [bacterium]
MNARGEDAGIRIIPYDGFHKVHYLRGWLLNGAGKEIRQLKSSDIKDYSAIQGFSLYEDGRVKYAALSHHTYPYTFVYEYEIAYDGILDWPAWWPQEVAGPVQKSIFEVRVPPDLPVRYHAVGLALEPKVTEDKGRRSYRWTVTDQPKLNIEALGPPYRVQAPHLLTGPARFEIAGRPGDMSSWDLFGAWFRELWKGRATLSPEDATRVADLCAGAETDMEKARRIYEYLQARTRYVNVSLGIGGWQPFDASYVSRLGYGDCKALTNYMIAMLGAAGIDAWPAFVMAGRNEPDLVEEFPSNQFNHVILFVPLAGDTLLVATPGGGRLVRTPVTSASENCRIRRARVNLEPTGNATADISTRYTGNQQADVRSTLATATPGERDEWLHTDLDITGFAVRSADFSDLDRKAGDMMVRASVDVPSLGSVSGPRLFVQPNLASRLSMRLPKVGGRTQPVRFSFAWIDADTISYRLPVAWTVESLPSDVLIEAPFGTYEASMVDKGGVVEYRRRLEVRHKSIPAADYGRFCR